ncbi:MAG: NUDIX hydrolase [Patescibacteria group bacterium]
MPILPPAHADRVYASHNLNVYEWPQTLYDGTTTTFDCVTRPDFVGVIAFLDAKTILLTKQEQPSRPAAFFDIPGGQVDKDETPEQAALRELQEETGYRAGQISLWKTSPYYGLVRFEQFLYIATDLTLDPTGNHEDAGEKIQVLKTPWPEAVHLALTGQIRVCEAGLAIAAMEYEEGAKKRVREFLK